MVHQLSKYGEINSMSTTELNPNLGYSCAGPGRRPWGSAPISNKALVSTKIPVGLDLQLRALAARDDVSMSLIIRRALEKEVAILA